MVANKINFPPDLTQMLATKLGTAQNFEDYDGTAMAFFLSPL